MNDRKSLLLQLIQQPQQAEAIARTLGGLDQACDRHLVEVTKMDVLTVLKLFDHARLTAEQVEGWARSLHGRMDIGYEFGDDGVVEEALFWLANPSLNWPINQEMHQRIVHLFERRSNKRD